MRPRATRPRAAARSPEPARSARSRRRVRRARPSASRLRLVARARSCCRSGAIEMPRPAPARLAPAATSGVRATSHQRVDVGQKRCHTGRGKWRPVDGRHREAELATLAAVETVLHHRRVLAFPQRRDQNRRAAPPAARLTSGTTRPARWRLPYTRPAVDSNHRRRLTVASTQNFARRAAVGGLRTTWPALLDYFRRLLELTRSEGTSCAITG